MTQLYELVVKLVQRRAVRLEEAPADLFGFVPHRSVRVLGVGAKAGEVHRLAGDLQFCRGQQFSVAGGYPRFLLQVRLDNGVERGDVGFPQPKCVFARPRRRRRAGPGRPTGVVSARFRGRRLRATGYRHNRGRPWRLHPWCPGRSANGPAPTRCRSAGAIGPNQPRRPRGRRDPGSRQSLGRPRSVRPGSGVGSKMSVKRSCCHVTLRPGRSDGRLRQGAGRSFVALKHQTGVVERGNRWPMCDRHQRSVRQTLLQYVIQVGLGVRIETGGCLVEEDPVRLCQQCPAEGNPLLLPAREARRPIVIAIQPAAKLRQSGITQGLRHLLIGKGVDGVWVGDHMPQGSERNIWSLR